MHSLTTKGTGVKKTKRNINVVKNKHYFHVRYGCNRSKCTTCFHGLPYQLLTNMINAKGGE